MELSVKWPNKISSQHTSDPFSTHFKQLKTISPTKKANRAGQFYEGLMKQYIHLVDNLSKPPDKILVVHDKHRNDPDSFTGYPRRDTARCYNEQANR